MSAIKDLESARHQFPGSLFAVLHEFEGRLQELEKHHPMLAEIKSHFDKVKEAETEDSGAAGEAPKAPAAPATSGTPATQGAAAPAVKK